MKKENIKVGVRVKNILFGSQYQNKIGTICEVRTDTFRVKFDNDRYDLWNFNQVDRFELYIPDDCS